MLIAITDWERALIQHTDLDRSTVTQYIGDAQRFVMWFRTDERGESFTDITVQDAKDYRDALVAARRAPATVNRALISLALLLDANGRGADNPFRKIARVGTVEHPPQALTRLEWHAVRLVAERLTSKDHGLALALTCLMRYAGPRVGEVTALQLPDVQLSSRPGLLIIRWGKGLKHRAVPLVLEAREPLEAYLAYRKQLADRWASRAAAYGQAAPRWATWPDGHLFLGQRGPLTARGVRAIIAKLGQAAKLEDTLSPIPFK